MSHETNLDSLVPDSIRSNKSSLQCPLDKIHRKSEDLEMHLQDTVHHENNANRKCRLRKSIKNDICPAKVRIVEFKYNGQVESLPINQKLNVNIISPENIDNECETEFTHNESKSKSNIKFKIRSKLNKFKNESSVNNQTLLNLQLPEPAYRMLNPVFNEFKEPIYSSQGYNRYYNRQDQTFDEDENDPVEYDMDEEDSIWLEMFNSKRRNERLLDISADNFEQMMDRLEKESFFQNVGNEPAIDEDAVCSICNDGECQNSNAILFCDMCNLAVHQECYGVPYIPEGQWLCRRCMQSPSRAVDCVLCPNKGGAFKQTDDNRWAHVICALWIPEVCFANTVFLEPIDSIVAIPTARWKLTCCVCHQKNSGACIQCHKSNCYVAFHVTCAQKAGLHMKIEAVKEVTQHGLVTSVRKTAFCSNHAPVSKNGCSNGIYSSGDEETKHVDKRDKKSDENSIFIPVSTPTIPIKRLIKIGELAHFPRRNDFLTKLYAYWKLKRESRNGVPLLRRLQSSNSTMRIDLNKEKCKRDKKTLGIRRNLENARLLLELIRKRERIKINILNHSRKQTVYKLNPFKQFLHNILEKIIEKDVDKFFIEPVSIEDVPDYLDYIKTPMDLRTMKTKVDHHEYSSFQDFENDLNIIIENCLLYNEKDTIWHKAALELQKCIQTILIEFKQYLPNYDQKSGIHAEHCRSNTN